MILKLYKSEALRFRSFKNKEEMNEHIAAHIFAAGKKLHRNARATLNMLANYSCVVTGVSWLNNDTIAEAIGVNERTVKRVKNRITLLGIGREEVVIINGMKLTYFVINPFDMSVFCPEIVNEVSNDQSDVRPTATRDESSFFDAETIEPSKPKDKKIVVERAPCADQSNQIVNYPTAITQKLSELNLKPNSATLKRWLSLANEETILQVIDDSVSRKNIDNRIGWITGVLQQGYVQTDQTKSIPKRYTNKPIKRDRVPSWIESQGQRSHHRVDALTEEQKREATELLAALDALA